MRCRQAPAGDQTPGHYAGLVEGHRSRPLGAPLAASAGRTKSGRSPRTGCSATPAAHLDGTPPGHRARDTRCLQPDEVCLRDPERTGSGEVRRSARDAPVSMPATKSSRRTHPRNRPRSDRQNPAALASRLQSSRRRRHAPVLELGAHKVVAVSHGANGAARKSFVAL